MLPQFIGAYPLLLSRPTGCLRQGLQALDELARPQDARATDENVLVQRLRHVMGEPQLAVREATYDKDKDPRGVRLGGVRLGRG